MTTMTVVGGVVNLGNPRSKQTQLLVALVQCTLVKEEASFRESPAVAIGNSNSNNN